MGRDDRSVETSGGRKLLVGVHRIFVPPQTIDEGFQSAVFRPKRAAAGRNLIRGFVFARAKSGLDARLSERLTSGEWTDCAARQSLP